MLELLADVTRLGDWRAPVEIALIGLGLYLLYRNFSAMGAWKAMSVLLAGLGLYAVARLFDLRGIEWILSHFTSVALLAIIVLFQPELRRMFERFATFRRSRRTPIRPRLASLVADVLFDLTQRSWGAIIVVPGKESIAPWVAGGIPLEARPSAPLLLSLFDPDSPGHDGAIILDGELLTAFGVRLPLSKSGKLPNVLGTRHHAALGLAEVTDALVFVVSEERRTVSACNAGRLHAISDKPSVVSWMEQHWDRVLGAAEASGSRLNRVAWGPLAASLVIAALFWFSILPKGGVAATEMWVTVPVEYAAIPPRLGLVGAPIERARIQISGEPADLSNVDVSTLRVLTDLSEVVEGEQHLPLAGQAVDLPRGVHLVDIDPPSVVIEAVPLVEREIAIEPQFVGEPPSGYRVAGVVVRPGSLVALVPARGISVPEAILTAPIHLDSTTGRTRSLVELILPAGIEPVGRAPHAASVSFSVEAVP